MHTRQAKEDPKLVEMLLNTNITHNPAFRRELRTQLAAIPFDDDDDGP